MQSNPPTLWLIAHPSRRTTRLERDLHTSGYTVLNLLTTNGLVQPPPRPNALPQENPTIIVEASLRDRLPEAWRTRRTLVIHGAEVLPRADNTPLPVLVRLSLQSCALYSDEQQKRIMRLSEIAENASGVVHDFNNILTIVAGTAAMLSREPNLSENSRDLITRIQEATAQGEGLTQQLLGGKLCKPRRIELNKAIQDLSPVLQRACQQTTLQTTLHPSPIPMLIDPGHLQRVLLNIVLNAVAAAPQGHIQIRTWQEHQDAFLSVEDNGVGMTPEVQARIFEPFFTTRASGNGIGMANVQHLVSINHGSLQITSSAGNGCTITLSFPMAAEHTETPGRPTPTILLVEDDSMTRLLMQSVLKQAGYTVLEAVSGEQALEILDDQKGNVDLLVADLYMPGMNGRQLATQVQTLVPECPTLIVTASGDEVGDLPALFKPFSLARFLRRVDMLLEA